ncbi:DUF998 domain-containing protein [Dyella sp.]|uniref:DUF998 domain-containing protein n=1 Tax=Dyella sp. TaxID=1869338 RepID=UPI002C8C7D87|nr:DUF998 domain-containing protein [Dyella sp.]HTC29077.1 DUF998 domain-containing protein [Dyella sp.]
MSALRNVITIRRAAYLMAIAVLVFTGVCAAAQFWRTDLNFIRTPLSTYLRGPGGVYVRSVYYLMAAALLAFAWAVHEATLRTRRSLLASLLFAGAGLILPIVAASELFSDTPYHALAKIIHRSTTLATFLWLSFGMVLLSSRWLRDQRMKEGSRFGLVLAWLATFVLWFQVLVSIFPNGLMEKLAIALILIWLGWASRHLLRATQPE